MRLYWGENAKASPVSKGAPSAGLAGYRSSKRVMFSWGAFGKNWLLRYAATSSCVLHDKRGQIANVSP